MTRLDLLLVDIVTADDIEGIGHGERRWHQVAGEPAGAGLAVTPVVFHTGQFGGLWTVTHISSGHAVRTFAACIACARGFASRLVSTGIDWTRTFAALRPDRDEVKRLVDPHIEWFELCRGGRCGR